MRLMKYINNNNYTPAQLQLHQMSVLRASTNSQAPPTGMPNRQQGEGKSWFSKRPNSGETTVYTKGNRHLNDITSGDRSRKQMMATAGWK